MTTLPPLHGGLQNRSFILFLGSGLCCCTGHHEGELHCFWRRSAAEEGKRCLTSVVGDRAAAEAAALWAVSRHRRGRDGLMSLLLTSAYYLRAGPGARGKARLIERVNSDTRSFPLFLGSGLWRNKIRGPFCAPSLLGFGRPAGYLVQKHFFLIRVPSHPESTPAHR